MYFLGVMDFPGTSEKMIFREGEGSKGSKLWMMPKIQNFFGYYPVLAPWLLLEELFSSPSWVFVTEFELAGLSKWTRWDS